MAPNKAATKQPRRQNKIATQPWLKSVRITKLTALKLNY